MTPLVSIIIPCYNAERWVAETLESALAQTWPNVEIIVVNDGSRDNSLVVAQAFISRGVRVVDQKNQGASAARNHGLRLAKGDFIQFLDADDLLSPDKIAEQMKLLQTQRIGAVASCAWGRFTDDYRKAVFVDDAVFRDFEPLDFLKLAADAGVMMHPSAWLVPRSVADQAGPWDESLSLNDDGEYFCRVLLASSGVAFCRSEKALSFYRSGMAGSLSQQRSARAKVSQFHSVELVGKHMRAREDSPRIRESVANLYQRFIFDFFPEPKALIRVAEDRIAELGGSSLPIPAMGQRTKQLAAVLGWKNVWRFKHLLQRIKS